jgi:hypothetical protein
MKSEFWLRFSIILINTVGLVGFLLWLVYSRERIFYTQEGVLYFLPCLPFFFVYFFVFRTARAEEDLGD